MTTTRRNLNRRQVRIATENLIPFINSTGSLRGVEYPDTISKGWLNDEETNNLLDDQTKPGIAYIVYSYDTPIAWVCADGRKYRVSQKFTRTTSCHMGMTWVSDPRPIDTDA